MPGETSSAGASGAGGAGGGGLARVAAVLANDNVQGLLLACRMLDQASYSRVWCSIGGPLCYLLEVDNSSLWVEDGYGRLREVKTRVLKRGPCCTSKAEETAPRDVLWLCDWRDTESAWYSLRECHYIFQTSKATDSRTVAMWLVEVCRPDCVIISLQSGLNNSREMRKVFGRKSGARPLSSSSTAAAASASGAASWSADELLGRALRGNSTEQRDRMDSTTGSVFSSGEDEEPAAAASNISSPTPKPRMSLIPRQAAAKPSPSNSPPSPSVNARHNRASVEDDEDEDDDEEKKPDVVLLAGVLGFGACAVRRNKRETEVLLTNHGAIVLERLSRTNSLVCLPGVMLLERTAFSVQYRPVEEMANWLWGDLVWRTFETYAAAVANTSPDKQSLYALLASRAVHRQILAGLLAEATLALKGQSVELMDPVASPLGGLSFANSTRLLLLPDSVFPTALRAVLRTRFFLEHRVRDSAAYCGNHQFHRQMAPFLNGEVVRVGFEADVSTPLNQEVIESLMQNRPVRVDDLALPALIPMPHVVAALSALVLLLAILTQVLRFVIDVTFFW